MTYSHHNQIFLQQKDSYLSKNRYLCNLNKRNYKNRTFQGIIIKTTIYESNRSRREIKRRFLNEPEYYSG